MAVDDSLPEAQRRGGYAWTVRFVDNPGSNGGRTFPPGSGDVSGTVANDGALTPSGVADASVREDVSGGPALSGSYTLELGGYVSGNLSVRASAVDVKTALNDLPSVGSVSVSRFPHVAQRASGLAVRVLPGDSEAVVVRGTPQAVFAPGDLIRLGGAGSGLAKAGTSGEEALPGTVALVNGSAELTASANVRGSVFPGQAVRL